MGKHARKDVAQGSLSSPFALLRAGFAAFPSRRGLGDAARENSDYLVGGAAGTRTAGNAAGPESGPCATCPRDVRRAFRRRGTACRPLVPHSPCGTPGRASPTPASPDSIHPFERRLRLCDPEAATADSSWELTVGSPSEEKRVAQSYSAPRRITLRPLLIARQ